MQRKRYEFVLEAAEPIAHHAESFGNEAIAMRRKIRAPAGWTSIPIVTADTMRHGLREASAYALLDAAGLLDNPSLSEAALRLLFAGGMVTGKSGGAVKLDSYRALCDLIPPLALLGGCAQNRIIPGRMVVEDATLVCVETAGFVPAWVTDFAGDRFGAMDVSRACVEEVQRVRMDPALVPEKRRLLTASDAATAEHRLLASEAASEVDDARGGAQSKSSMMPRRFERIAQGSLFSWAVEATVYSELELDTFHVMLSSFLARARVGGKKGTGHGLLRLLAAENIAIRRSADESKAMDIAALAPRVGEAFRAHVHAHADELAWALENVDA